MFGFIESSDGIEYMYGERVLTHVFPHFRPHDSLRYDIFFESELWFMEKKRALCHESHLVCDDATEIVIIGKRPRTRSSQYRPSSYDIPMFIFTEKVKSEDTLVFS